MACLIGVDTLERKTMSSKNKISATTRLTEEEFKRLESKANVANMSISALLKLLINGVCNGDIEIEKGEIKLGVDPIGYAVSEESNEDFKENLRYKEFKLDRLLTTFEKRNYPDWLIRQSIEQIMCQINESGNYNPKRGYDSDTGC